MIGSLNGTVLVRDDPFLIIEVSGIGYKVYASQDVLSQASVGSKITTYTYTHVREDILELYGFLKYLDLKLFELLINVSGIGPKTGIGIFAIGSASQITQAISNADVAFFTSVPRLGTKNAQKIIIELKNKIGGGDLDLSGDSNAISELSSALRAFGFSKDEISDAVRRTDGNVSIEEQIKLALKHLGK